MNDLYLVLAVKLFIIGLLVAFLPLAACSYYFFRRQQREREVQRILGILGIRSEYRKNFKEFLDNRNMAVATGFASVVSAASLGTLFLGEQLKLSCYANLPLGGGILLDFDQFSLLNKNICDLSAASPELVGNLFRYQHGALIVVGMAFLGAYLWGLQHIYRRYATNDLTPIAFYHLGVRMIFASVTALLVYHTTFSLAGTTETDALQARMLPAIAFFIGMFPQRGVSWLANRLHRFAYRSKTDDQALPLEMIEGMTFNDHARLAELGIDNCNDLADADYIPLLLKTPYAARQLIDWILQAKLCVNFGPSVKTLRKYGIRSILDLEHIDVQLINDITGDDPGIKPFNLIKSQQQLADPNIDKLRRASDKLSQYWEAEAALPRNAARDAA